MTAKEYLNQYRNAYREIQAKVDQIARLRDLVMHTTSAPAGDRVQSSPENKLERIVAKIADMEAEVDEEIDRLADKRREVQAVIEKVPNHAQREVLIRRYMVGQKWEEIAVELDYHYRWVLELHGRALPVVESILVKRDRKTAL